MVEQNKINLTSILVIIISLIIILSCVAIKVHNKKIMESRERNYIESNLYVLQSQISDIQSNPQIIKEDISERQKQDIINKVTESIPKTKGVATDCIMIKSDDKLNLNCYTLI